MAYLPLWGFLVMCDNHQGTPQLYLLIHNIPSYPAGALVRFLEKEFPGATIQLVYEAGCFGYWIHDAMVAAGVDVVIVASHQLPKDLLKTDRLDASKLARLLASGLLKGIWVPDVQQRLDRSLVRRRAQLVKARGRLQDQIKKLLLGVKDRVNRSTPVRVSWST